MDFYFHQLTISISVSIKLPNNQVITLQVEPSCKQERLSVPFFLCFNLPAVALENQGENQVDFARASFIPFCSWIIPPTKRGRYIFFPFFICFTLVLMWKIDYYLIKNGWNRFIRPRAFHSLVVKGQVWLPNICWVYIDLWNSSIMCRIPAKKRVIPFLKKRKKKEN